MENTSQGSVEPIQNSNPAGQPASTPAPAAAPVSNPAEAAPAYVTREQLETSIAQMTESLAGLYRNLEHQIRSAPAPAPARNTDQWNLPIPEAREFESVTDNVQLHKVLVNLYKDLTTKIGGIEEKMQTKFQQEETARMQKEKADQYYNYLQGQINVATKSHTVFQSEDARAILESQVAAELYRNGGDLSRVSIPAIAKRIADFAGSGRAPAALDVATAGAPGAGLALGSGIPTKPELNLLDPNKQYSSGDISKAFTEGLAELDRFKALIDRGREGK